jgi:phospholipid/cholesterol/gamma-HCH transport system ATP-binding protein
LALLQPAIELRDVTVRFGSETLLAGVNLTILAGETLVLIGPSGHGKSTLLKLIAGLIEPSSGDVLIEGRSFSSMSPAERLAIGRKMGMLFQKNALFDSLTCGENVAFPLRELGVAREDEIETITQFFLEAVGISHARDLNPDEISGGMQKRLGIARALALRPQIVLYDDPTAGLDPITSRRIIQLIQDRQKKSNSTVVAVTNDMHRASQMADRIAMVVDGELIVCGTPEETKKYSDPRVQQFIRGELKGPLMVTA